MSKEDSIEAIPRSGEFSDTYHRMLELAEDYLTDLVSAKIDAWEDGTFRIKIFHHVPASDGREEALYYHSEEGKIIYGVIDDDSLETREVIEES